MLKKFLLLMYIQMIPILMYHQVGTPPPKGSRLRGSTVHPARFQSQMRWLSRLGYQGLSLASLAPYLRGEKKGKVIGITFDDGYQNVYENALPVLSQLGFSSTNFIVSGELGGENHWAQQTGSLPSKLMTVEQIKDWHRQGHEIGSHTINHIYVAKTEKKQALKELIGSKQTLEQLLQEEITSFCFPFGNENEQARQWVKEAGYELAVTTARGLARDNEDLYALPRVNILRSTLLIHFLRKTMTSYEDKKRGR